MASRVAKLGFLLAPGLVFGLVLAPPAFAVPDRLGGDRLGSLPGSQHANAVPSGLGAPGRAVAAEVRSPVAARVAAVREQITPPTLPPPPVNPGHVLPGDQSDVPVTVPTLPPVPPPPLPTVTDLPTSPTTLPNLPTTAPPTTAPPATGAARSTSRSAAVAAAPADTAAPAANVAVPAAPVTPALPPGLFGGPLGDVAPAVAATLPSVTGYRRSATRAMATLAFSVLVAVAVLLFLALQGRFDRHDPKLAGAPINDDDDMVGFG